MALSGEITRVELGIAVLRLHMDGWMNAWGMCVCKYLAWEGGETGHPVSSFPSRSINPFIDAAAAAAALVIFAVVYQIAIATRCVARPELRDVYKHTFCRCPSDRGLLIYLNA